MECTQRLECTQDTFAERTCPEQVGFLGICGSTYPVKKGPNKIGRDPSTCSIVLNLNSISRHHAVINVINSKEFMIMDLDSANKTRLLDKILPPYIPQPLKNGDMLQFGDIFGVFRVLEDEGDLPMTQALDMPETPLAVRHTSKLNKYATVIPESPDVSDREESFIGASQKEATTKNPNNNFIKPNLPHVGNKINNVFWNSSKKSKSFNLSSDNSNVSFNDSAISLKDEEGNNEENIHEMETQAAFSNSKNDNDNSIHNANTQLPSSIFNADTQLPSPIHTVNTQLPSSIFNTDTEMPNIYNENTQAATIHTADTQIQDVGNIPSIHNVNTQLPEPRKLPQVQKVHEQSEMQLDIITPEKSHMNIFNAETQLFDVENKIINENKDKEVNKITESDDPVLFDEFDSQFFVENCESQPILSEYPFEIEKDIKHEVIAKDETPMQLSPEPAKRASRTVSDSSTDCEDIDIPPNQSLVDVKICDSNSNDAIRINSPILPAKKAQRLGSGDSTDCEDIDILPKQKILPAKDDNLTDCEDEIVQNISNNIPFEEMATQVIDENDLNLSSPKRDDQIEDMATQIIDDVPNDSTVSKENSNCVDFDELPTQIIEENPQNISNNLMSPFKMPMSPAKVKRKDPSKSKTPSPIAKLTNEGVDNKFYEATQDILEDLCTQKIVDDDNDIVPSSVENYEVGKRFPGLENESTSSNENNEKVNNYIKNLSNDKINDVISVAKLKKMPSDPSDTESETPKKTKPIKYMDIDLPDSQEIKTGVSWHCKSAVTESSSDSDAENNSEDQHTPILFKKHKRIKTDAKIDLTKKFENLPTRIITRVRKPTQKLKKDETVKLTNILKPNFLTEQEENIDKEIITENITRLKSKTEKNKDNKKSPVVDKKSDSVDHRNEAKFNKIVKINLTKHDNRDTKIDLTVDDDMKLEVCNTKINKCIGVATSSNNIKSVKELKYDPVEVLPKSNDSRRRGRRAKNDKGITGSGKLTVSKQPELKLSDVKNDDISESNKSSKRVRNVRSKNNEGAKINVETVDKSNKTEDNSKKNTENERKSNEQKRKSDRKESESQETDKKLQEKVKLSIAKNKDNDNKTVDKCKKSTEKERKSNEQKIKSDPLQSESQETDRRLRERGTRSLEEKKEMFVKIRKMLAKDKMTPENETKSQETEIKSRTRRTNEKETTPQENEIKSRTRRSNEKEKRTKEIDTKTNTDSQKQEPEKTRKRRGRPPKSSKSPSPLPDKDIRRSKRQKNQDKPDIKIPDQKQSTEPQVQQLKSILKSKTHEQSTVYNISSGSDNTPLKAAKRPATEDLNVSSAKKKFSTGSNTSLRSTPARMMKTQNVLFTAFPNSNNSIIAKLEKLGAVIVSDVTDCTVLATWQIKRTFKLLCAMGLGRPIVGPDWVEACVNCNILADPWLYLIKDEAAEKRFKFNLERTLRGKRNFLKGYNVSSTPNVMPSPNEMKLIVECSGGTWSASGPNWVCVSTPADKSLWSSLKRKGATIVTTEFILGGVLKQQVDIDGNKLA